MNTRKFDDDDCPNLADWEDDEPDEFEAAMSECGYSPQLGFCTMAGTEFCDWECPLAEFWESEASKNAT